MQNAIASRPVIDAGYVHFDLSVGPFHRSVVLSKDVIEEHALRRPMSHAELRKYVQANLPAFVDAVKRTDMIGGSNIILIDRIEDLTP
jgi:hypothetical protein